MERLPDDRTIRQLAERIFDLDQGLESPAEGIQQRGPRGQQVFRDGKVLRGRDAADALSAADPRKSNELRKNRGIRFHSVR